MILGRARECSHNRQPLAFACWELEKHGICLDDQHEVIRRILEPEYPLCDLGLLVPPILNHELARAHDTTLRLFEFLQA
jgi:hypothetical protein